MSNFMVLRLVSAKSQAHISQRPGYGFVPRTEGNFDALPKKTVLQRLQPNFGIDDVIVNSKHTFLTRIFPPPRNLALQGALKRKESLLRLVLNFKLSPNMFLSKILSSQKPNSI